MGMLAAQFLFGVLLVLAFPLGVLIYSYFDPPENDE